MVRLDVGQAGFTIAPMRSLLILGAAWTAVVVALLLFWPSGSNVGGCWRLVGASDACLAELDALNTRMWWTQTLPMLMLFASGYVVVGVMAFRRAVRTRRVTSAPPPSD